MTEVYSETYQPSKQELFAEIVISLQPLTIFQKRFILEVWQGPKSISVGCLEYFKASLVSVKWLEKVKVHWVRNTQI